MNFFKSIQELSKWISGKSYLILESKPKKLTRLKILLFSLATGDFNPAHCLPRFAKHSIFKSEVSHGIAVAARGEAEFVQLFQFDYAVEVITRGYLGGVKYLRPSPIGFKYHYVFQVSHLKRGKLRGAKQLWDADCFVRAFADDGKNEPYVVMEAHWSPTFVEHTDLSEHELSYLKPRSYLSNLFRIFGTKAAALCIAVWIIIEFTNLILHPDPSYKIQKADWFDGRLSVVGLGP